MSFTNTAEFITALVTIDLRHRILRPGHDRSICHYAEDNFSSTFHVGIRDVSKKVIANGTFMQQGHESFATAKKPYRLRGMATETGFQKQGLGRLIINFAEKELRQRNCDLLWFNARTSAEIFYQKLGFSTDPVVFDIPTVGPHKIMYKWL